VDESLQVLKVDAHTWEQSWEEGRSGRGLCYETKGRLGRSKEALQQESLGVEVAAQSIRLGRIGRRAGDVCLSDMVHRLHKDQL